MYVILFIAGLIVGGSVGYIMAAVITISSKTNNEEDD